MGSLVSSRPRLCLADREGPGLTTRLRQIKWSYLRFAFFDISQTNRARELWLGSKEASGNYLSSRYGNLRSSVFGKPKGQVTFGNFPEGKRQPSAEDFAERPFGSVFNTNRQTNRQTNEQTDKKKTDKRKNRHTNEQTERQTNTHKNRQTDKQTEKQTDKQTQTNEQRGRQTKEQTESQTNKQTDSKKTN